MTISTIVARLIIRRGTMADIAAELASSAITKHEGEPRWNTDTKQASVYDGSVLKMIAMLTSVPATASSAGNTGDFAYDSSYLYICVATNTWMRCPIATW